MHVVGSGRKAGKRYGAGVAGVTPESDTRTVDSRIALRGYEDGEVATTHIDVVSEELECDVGRRRKRKTVNPFVSVLEPNVVGTFIFVRAVRSGRC